MLSKLLAALLAAVCFALPVSVSAEEAAGIMRVYMNQARILKLDRPVSKVIIGNAQVADATVADPQTIVLTGRAFGATNLVLLDSEGNAIADERILVSIDEGNTVRVFRQTDRAVLSCTPACEQHANTNGAAGATAGN